LSQELRPSAGMDLEVTGTSPQIGFTLVQIEYTPQKKSISPCMLIEDLHGGEFDRSSLGLVWGLEIVGTAR
jgi:hypothetical protein